MSDTGPARPTPSSTVGPFFGFALPFDGGPQPAPPWLPGTISVHGTVYDGAGDPVPDALLETWQADDSGAIPSAIGSMARDPGVFTGFGRCPTDAAGHYRFATVRPGGEHPFISLVIFARGLLHHLYTRVYLPEDASRLPTAIPQARAASMIAIAERSAHRYRFDIHLQGERETVFLDFQ